MFIAEVLQTLQSKLHNFFHYPRCSICSQPCLPFILYENGFGNETIHDAFTSDVMMQMERSPHVCSMCKTRKKACDKRLPCCGYCSKRNLRCNYDTANHKQSISTENGMPHLIFTARLQNSSAKAPHLSLESWNSASSNPTERREVELNALLNEHVSQTLQQMSLSLDEIGEKYFQGFHIWLPIVCPQSFQDILTRYIIPPAELSILVLTMCLTAVFPPTEPFRNSDIGRPCEYYVFVKMLLSQIQAESSASISLLQSAVLISAHEYACGRPEAAYVSLAACVAMARNLGINNYQTLRAVQLAGEEPRPKSIEAWNVWWGLIILER